jgi:acyl-CoA synthetase (AMP-forming)/AMP-acid ligase II
MTTIPIAALAAGAAAATAYLSARLSLEHDLLFLNIFGSTALNLVRAVRQDRVSVFYVLEKHATTNPTSANRPFLRFEGREYTYAQTYDTVLRYGHWLATAHGVRKGDVVALDFTNSDQFVFLWFALWAIGATPAFINHHLTGAPLVHSLKSSTATLALVDPRVESGLTGEVRGELAGIWFFVVTEGVEREAISCDAVRYPDEVRKVDRYVGLAILIYTSGTTGLPKPAIMSWAKIYVAAMMAAKGARLTKDDVVYLVSSDLPSEIRPGSTGWRR